MYFNGNTGVIMFKKLLLSLALLSAGVMVAETQLEKMITANPEKKAQFDKLTAKQKESLRKFFEALEAFSKKIEAESNALMEKHPDAVKLFEELFGAETAALMQN